MTDEERFQLDYIYRGYAAVLEWMQLGWRVETAWYNWDVRPVVIDKWSGLELRNTDDAEKVYWTGYSSVWMPSVAEEHDRPHGVVQRAVRLASPE